MPRLKSSQIQAIDDAFNMHGGYVLDFSDRTFGVFFDESFSIDIFSAKYASTGTSKAKRLRAFLQAEDAFIVCRIIRALWDYRQAKGLTAGDWPTPTTPAKENDIRDKLFAMVAVLESSGGSPSLDALERFAADETLEELVAAIARDIEANKPAPALDRLHTYCMKKMAHLLAKRAIQFDRDDPLHSRLGKYVKALEADRTLRELSRRSIKSAISLFDAFNDVRNNASLAHGNVLVDQAEARYIFDVVTAILRFLKSLEADRFGA
jgi:hypothetical protein